MAHRTLIPFLVGMMLLTGVCNTLLQKYQDMQCMENCDSPDPNKRKSFEQPIWQTVQMFIGEAGCFLIVGLSSLVSLIRGRKTPSPSSAGYQPVSTGEEIVNDDAITVTAGGGARETIDAGSIHEDEPDPAAKPLNPVAPLTPERQPLKGWRVILLAVPATCDILGTTLMNVGLLFVAASIYQMTRGALVLFVGLFSVIFLKRHLPFYKWAALFIVVGGVAIVGLAGYVEHSPTTGPKIPPDNEPYTNLTSTTIPATVYDDSDLSTDLMSSAYTTAKLVVRDIAKDTPLSAVIGVAFTALAQIFTAFQFVSEEVIMHRYSLSPLVVVGWEGTFGLIITLIGLGIAHAAYGSTPAGQGGYFDAVTGLHQMVDNPRIAVASILIMFSIGSFNFFGLSVTRSVSATARSTIDTCRTLFIWIVSLGLGWEAFKWLQVVGFIGLVYGTFLFNDVVGPPRMMNWIVLKFSRKRRDGDPVLA